MADYRALRGVTITTVDGDPSNLVAGDIWYNSSTKKIKVRKQTTGAWATGTALNTGRSTQATAGTQTAGLCAGGNAAPAPSVSALSEEWNGTAWAEGNNIQTARRSFRGTGTQTAALAVGGSPPANGQGATEEYDGTTWSEQSDRRNGYSLGLAGTQTAGLAMGGYDGNAMEEVDEYNGSSWTAGGAMPAAVYSVNGIGTQTAGLAVSGSPGRGAKAIEYDGSSWTEGGDTPANWAYSHAAGIQTAAISASNAVCATYNGTAWTEVADLNSPRSEGDGSNAGTTAATSVYGGGDPAPDACEDFNDPTNTTATVTSS